MGRKSLNNNNISNDHQIYEICNTLLWRLTPWLFTKRGRYPLPPINNYDEYIPSKVISRKLTIIRRWSRNAFHKGSSDLMVTTQANYTIP